MAEVIARPPTSDWTGTISDPAPVHDSNKGDVSINSTNLVPQWKVRAAEKRTAQLSQIPEEWRLAELPNPLPVSTLAYLDDSDLLTPQEKAITSTLSAQELLSRIHCGGLSAHEVAVAFCKRAAYAQQLSKCCTEMFFDRALEHAKQLDNHFQETGRLLGPLHGLPVSLKDLFEVEGFDTTIGWVGLCGKPASKNSVLADMLLKQGAVLYCKTNISQSLMMSDSYNHVFKQSVNALNRKLISGGSSGGEGALVGCHASLIGIGTDIGGSIRIPANLQGLYGLCPTVGRFPWDSSVSREYIVNPVAGPLTSSLSSVETFMERLLASYPWEQEPNSYPIHWRADLAKEPGRKLKIGYYVDDGLVKVQPPHERAVKEVVALLDAAGHTSQLKLPQAVEASVYKLRLTDEVVEWDTSSHPEAHRLWTKAILADGGQSCNEMLAASEEPLVQGMLVGKESDRLSAEEAIQLSHTRLEYQKTYMNRWNEAQLDALIMPVQPWVGFLPKTWVQSDQCVSYTGHWNFVDFAALTVPATTARAADIGDKSWLDHVPRNASDKFNWVQYNPELVKGMPVGVQIVGGRFGEERCVAVAKVLEVLRRGKVS